MRCTSPIVLQGMALPCRQCLPCLLNRRRIWTHRLLLEQTQHSECMFVTLTYDDAHMPKLSQSYGSSNGLGTLHPKHLQDWLKRFRKAIEPSKIRFFACGEYGDETERPHYHAIIFGFGPCLRGRTRRSLGSSRSDWRSCCAVCRVVGETWGLGDIEVGTVEASSCQYVAGYVTKKMTRFDDDRLAGRHPEFARMSNRPGIGRDAMDVLANEFLRLGLDKTQPDVPSALRHGPKLLPLGRYLQRRLRVLVGREEKTPDEVIQKVQQELSAVRQAAFDNSESFSVALREARKGEAYKVKSRFEIFKQRKSI